MLKYFSKVGKSFVIDIEGELLLELNLCVIVEDKVFVILIVMVKFFVGKLEKEFIFFYFLISIRFLEIKEERFSLIINKKNFS